MAATVNFWSLFVASSSIRCSSSSPNEKNSNSIKIRDDWRRQSKPICPGGVYPTKDHCSRCGLCDTYYIAHVKNACAFLGDGMSRIEKLEPRAHGRGRGESLDEMYFGVHEELLYARKIKSVEGAPVDRDCNYHCSRNAKKKFGRSGHLRSE